MAGERSEQPTPRRRQEARRRGQVPRSREVDSALTILAAFMVIRIAGGAMWEGLSSLMTDSFRVLDKRPVNMELSAAVGVSLIGRALLLLAPLMGGILGLSLLGGMAQTGGP